MNGNSKLFYLVLSTIVVLNYSCQNQGTSQVGVLAEGKSVMTLGKSKINYNFAVADRVLNLHADLSEISGLAYDTISGMLIGVNDELGKIYHINKTDGRTVNIEKFGKKGDYEGIATNASTTYILKSNGNVYAYDRSTAATTKYKTGLTADQDAEGLLLREDGNLLIACKGNTKTGAKTVKNVFRYDIDQQTLGELPLMTIHDSTLTALIDQQQISSKAVMRSLKKRAKDFSPSAIALVPNSAFYFILSARGSTLVICTESQVIDIIFLDEQRQPQPEGICFDNDHNLYIANEGRGLGARVFVYHPLKS